MPVLQDFRLCHVFQVIVNIKTVRILNFVSALSAVRNFITMSLLLLVCQSKMHFLQNNYT